MKGKPDEQDEEFEKKARQRPPQVAGKVRPGGRERFEDGDAKGRADVVEGRNDVKKACRGSHDVTEGGGGEDREDGEAVSKEAQ